jgi:hypothetical protein
VVLEEGENAVAPGVERLEAVEEVAVRLEDVDVVLGGVPDRQVAQDEAVGAVGEHPDVLLVTCRGRTAVAAGGVARLDHDVVGAHAGALELEVAADARPRARYSVAVLARRVRHLALADPAADHGDEVRVVGAVDLVGVGERARVTGVRVDLVLVARGVVRRLRA